MHSFGPQEHSRAGSTALTLHLKALQFILIEGPTAQSKEAPGLGWLSEPCYTLVKPATHRSVFLLTGIPTPSHRHPARKDRPQCPWTHRQCLDFLALEKTWCLPALILPNNSGVKEQFISINLLESC